MDIVRAAQRLLSSTTSITVLLHSSATYPTWLWRWKPYAEVEGTGSSGIVLSARGGWTGPNTHNTARFPALQVEILSDVDRSLGGNPTGRTAEERANEVFEAVDRVLHQPGGGAQWWGGGPGEGIRVVTSHRGAEPTFQDVPEGDGLVRCLARYNLTLG